jgi:hypothetical protein
VMENLVNSNDRTNPNLSSLTMCYLPRLIDFRIQSKKTLITTKDNLCEISLRSSAIPKVEQKI